MIRVNRGSEPRELAKVRRRELARAILHWSSSDATDFTGYPFEGYRAAATTLYCRQYRKCAFCERRAGWENQPVEHFRPKGGAQRDAKKRDPHHYWWLAWSWDNLFFACSRCNGALTKANHFPLEAGTAALPLPAREAALALDPASLDLSAERPLLIDPSRDDPMDHIVWMPMNEGEPWNALFWRPQGVDQRGRVTIETLALGGIHAGDVSMAIQQHLTPKMERIVRLHRKGDGAEVTATWEEVASLVAFEAEHAAAMRNACDWFLQQPEVPAPGRKPLYSASPDAVAEAQDQDEVDPPGDPYAAYSPRLQLQMRGEMFSQRVREGVLALCAEKDLTEKTLATLLGCTLKTVQEHRRVLVKEGKLQKLASGAFRAATAAK